MLQLQLLLHQIYLKLHVSLAITISLFSIGRTSHICIIDPDIKQTIWWLPDCFIVLCYSLGKKQPLFVQYKNLTVVLPGGNFLSSNYSILKRRCIYSRHRFAPLASKKTKNVICCYLVPSTGNCSTNLFGWASINHWMPQLTCVRQIREKIRKQIKLILHSI